MRGRAGLILLSLALVALAFARAQYFSSTGIRIAGDGADYAAIAAALELEGRAPFVYRPAVPMLVGFLFPGALELGFSLVCAAAMLATFLLAGSATKDRAVGYLLVGVLFLNYQVLFAAANVARLDIVVLAIQLCFVRLALRGKSDLFFWLLPFAAPVKETMLLGLGALVLMAFPRRLATFVRFGVSAGVFLTIHLLIRVLARPTAAMPPYDEGPSFAALGEMLAGNLTAMLPLHFFVAWSGLCVVAIYGICGPSWRVPRATIAEGVAQASAPGDGPRPDALRLAAGALLLAFPLPLATDVHRAWFELFAPVVLFAILATRQRALVSSTGAASARRALAAALAASFVPYAARGAAPQHLHLLILQNRLTPVAIALLVVALVASGVAAVLWRRSRRD